MDILAGIVLSALVGWFVVYTAARGAIGDVLQRRPTFRLAWVGGDASGVLEIENVGPAPVFEVAVRVPAGDAPVTPALVEALMVQPGERVRAAVSPGALPPGGLVRDGQRVVKLAVRYLSAPDANERQRVELVPVLVDAPGTGTI